MDIEYVKKLEEQNELLQKKLDVATRNIRRRQNAYRNYLFNKCRRINPFVKYYPYGKKRVYLCKNFEDIRVLNLTNIDEYPKEMSTLTKEQLLVSLYKEYARALFSVNVSHGDMYDFHTDVLEFDDFKGYGDNIQLTDIVNDMYHYVFCFHDDHSKYIEDFNKKQLLAIWFISADYLKFIL